MVIPADLGDRHTDHRRSDILGPLHNRAQDGMEQGNERMNILYIAPFARTDFLREFGGRNPTGLACTRKVGLIGRELEAQGHHVQILSSYMLSYRAMSWRKEMTEQLSESCRVLYPGAWMMRPVGSVLNWLRANHIVHKLFRILSPTQSLRITRMFLNRFARTFYARKLEIYQLCWRSKICLCTEARLAECEAAAGPDVWNSMVERQALSRR